MVSVCVDCELYYRGYHLLNPVEFLRAISTFLGWNYFSKSKFGWNMNLFHSSIHTTCVGTPVNVEEIVESTLTPYHAEEMYQDEVEANTVFEFTVKAKGNFYHLFHNDSFCTEESCWSLSVSSTPQGPRSRANSTSSRSRSVSPFVNKRNSMYEAHENHNQYFDY